MKSSILLLGVAVVGAVAAPAPHYELHERRDVIPTSWTQGKRLDGSTLLPVRVGLTQSNVDYGHDLLMEMYAQLVVLIGSGADNIQGPTRRPAVMESICPSHRCMICSHRVRRAWTAFAPGWSRLASHRIGFHSPRTSSGSSSTPPLMNWRRSCKRNTTFLPTPRLVEIMWHVESKSNMEHRVDAMLTLG